MSFLHFPHQQSPMTPNQQPHPKIRVLIVRNKILKDMRRLNQESCYSIIYQAPISDSKMQDLPHTASRTNGRWTKEEHLKFLEGLRIHGKNWKKIEQLVQTRTGTQIRSHAQKFFLKSKMSLPNESNEISQGSCEFQEEPQEATLNSKSPSETGMQREDSYFLARILQFSSSKQCFDFWAVMVDCRDATAILNRSIRNSSFMAFQQGRQAVPSSCQKDDLLA